MKIQKEGFESILLQSNDLVYVPRKDELIKIKNGKAYNEAVDWTNKKKISDRIYKVNDFSKGTLYFLPHRISKTIVEKELHNSVGSKSEQIIIYPEIDKNGNDITEEPEIIKKVCIKLKVDRLGNITPL